MADPIVIERADEVGSTSELLKARAEAGAGEVALLADRQTAGHGRLGRSWVSPPGNLHLSVLLRPRERVTPGHWSLLAAVALAECVAPLASGVRLKWPNDVFLGDGKLAGILLEAGGDPPWLVIGYGVNLRHAPTDLGRPVATLTRPDREPPASTVFAAHLLARLIHWRRQLDRHGFAPVRAAWLSFGPTPGQVVAVGAPEGRIEGSFAGVDEQGALLLDADGRVRAIHSGAVE